MFLRHIYSFHQCYVSRYIIWNMNIKPFSVYVYKYMLNKTMVKLSLMNETLKLQIRIKFKKFERLQS